MMKRPDIIVGGTHEDVRGLVSFVNDFQLDDVKRFYTIEHPDESVIRAWQGHKREQKWFFVVAGGFQVVVVSPDNWENPSHMLATEEYALSVHSANVLHIPGGYANGFKATEPNSKLIIFSDFTVEESINDNYRFDQELWYEWNKK